MQNKPSLPSLPGRKKTIFPAALINYLALISLLIFANGSSAAMETAKCNLAIAFDLENQQLKGIASFQIPAQNDLSVLLGPLQITALELNGNLISRSNAPSIAVTATDLPQRLTIHYQTKASDGDLISPTGIALTNFWHPIPETKYQYTIQASLPADFTGISEADSIQVIKGAQNTVDIVFSQPLHSIHFIAGPYIVEKEPFGAGNSKTLYSYFFKEDQDLARQYRQKAKQYLERYEALIGPYPYQRFSIVENRLPTGYAMPTFTLLGQSIVRLPFIVDTSLGHEVLHSWFGNALGVERSSGNWCEGLTTYLADQLYAADQGKGAEFRKGQLLKYQSYINDETAAAITDFKGGDSSRDAKQMAARAIGYGKVSMLFHMLRKQVGDDAFYTALQELYKNNQGNTLSWQDIEDTFTQPEIADLDNFFSQWLKRTDVPMITGKDFKLTEEEGKQVLSFTLVQGTEEPYSLHVPISVHSDNGTLQKIINTDEKEKKIELSLIDTPRSLVIDQQYDIMRTLDNAEIPPSWSWFKGATNKLAIINSSGEYDLYAPFIDSLEQMGAKVLAADEVTDKDLLENAIIFLGLSGQVPRSLFATPDHPQEGMTVDIRRNPLNQEYPAVLVSTSSQKELKLGLKKLTHYGKYSYLHFKQGKTIDRQKSPSPSGIRYALTTTPLAIQTQKSLQFAEIIEHLNTNRVIYVGESHTRYEDHKLQLMVIRDLYRTNPNLVIGMEMFPSSVQKALDDFISGEIDETTFIKESKYFEVWRYDYRLYREILNFARSNKIPVIGLNIDKEIVSKVYKEGGVSALGPEELMDLPIDRDLDVPGYRERINSVFKLHPGQEATANSRFAGFFQAQAIWDETMAANVATYLTDQPESTMVVIAGRGHILKEEAIPPRVKRRIKVKQAIIVSADGTELYPNEADYIVFMPKSTLPPRALMGIVMGMDDDKKTVKINEVKKDSPADKAGIEDNDILLAIDDAVVNNIEDVKILMLAKNIGDTIQIKIKRPRIFFADEELTLDLKL